MQTTVTNGEITTVFDVAEFNVNVGECAKIDVNEAVNYIKSGQAEVQEVVDAGTATFNANASAKTEAFNNNATAKTNAFNTNASSKTADFNSNASSKTGDFNTNATSKTTAFDENATAKTNTFNQNATDKTTAFNTNYTEKKALIDEQVGIATTQAGIATTKASEASTSASNASLSEQNASSYADSASQSALDAATSETNASESANNASQSATTATEQASIATSKAAEASSSATSASNSSSSASSSATTATNQANLAKQYAIGEPSEPTEHSAKYWAEQAESELSGLSSRVTTIEGKIPSSASSSNQLTDKDYVDTQDNALQSQIDALVVSSDVFDIVGTYAELQAYDISTVPVNDIIKVLIDSTHSNAATYYRCVESGGVKSWSYIGSEGAYYTKAEANALLDEKQDTLASGTNIKTVNGNSLLGSGDVNISAVATWGNITGTLSNQTDLNNALNAKQDSISDLSTIRSGASLGASALQPNDNITQLYNNAGYITGITSSDVTTALGYTPVNPTSLATVATSGSYNDLSSKPPHIIETYVNGTSWYRVYSDGWCEQGGYISALTTNYTQYDLLKQYKDTNYSIFSSYAGINGNTSSFSGRYSIPIKPYSTSKFITAMYGATESCYWQACGYIS